MPVLLLMPKKVRAPYRSYKSSDFSKENSDDLGQDEDDDKSSNKSAGVLSKCTLWPVSKFEKINVLNCALQDGEPKVQSGSMHNLVVFPIEIFIKIFEILEHSGELKPKFMRVCKLFYQIILPMIYRAPHLRATNFFKFVETLSNNKRLGHYIYSLDLAYVNQSGKNAFVARLLKQSKAHLESFVAPQTSFGFGPLIALKNCQNLKILDLRLVSETSSIEINDYQEISWPAGLTFLRLSGGIDDDFPFHSNLPSSITSLEFAHCPSITDFGLKQFLNKIGANLKSFKVQYPMPGLKGNTLDDVFHLCPNLRVLEVYVDYLSSTFFDESLFGGVDYSKCLRTLYINSSGSLGTSNRLDPIDLAIALEDGRFPLLKNVQCTAKLGWNPKSESVRYIAEELDERNGGLYIGY
ncbi:hypothetical protein KGF56_000912 [Candida oxycetoniae]|uniref:F-box domain-containing protein n=1 Tax=Candida oxycetoniae TaxID=497107 RepID=A0AAI9WZI1_9ASCO|nr:uncharacterized protein KGF56_000912 [Candida oxycetoniae]KAI3406431.2 hypothetical protein KGF56_000912 [Candida oxycetoniae]